MVHFAILGCGRIAQRHAIEIAKVGKLLAVCDIDAEKARTLAANYNCNYYTSLSELLHTEPTIQVIAICTPNGLHASHSIACLKAGLHVLCEKPLAITTMDANAMLQCAVENKNHLFIVKQNRFNPPVLAIKKVLEEGRLGKVFSFQLNCFWNRNADYYANSWKGTLALDGGTLFTQFSHFIDLLYWLFGDVQDVVSFMANLNHQNSIEFEDTGIVLLKFENAILGSVNYTVNSYKKNMEGSLTIFGEKGTVKIGGKYLNELDYQEIENYTIPNLPVGNIANQYENYEGSMSNHDKVYENIVEVLNNNAPVYASALDGLKTVEIIERIYNSKS
jgi:predicted dehydrogenase